MIIFQMIMPMDSVHAINNSIDTPNPITTNINSSKETVVSQNTNNNNSLTNNELPTDKSNQNIDNSKIIQDIKKDSILKDETTTNIIKITNSEPIDLEPVDLDEVIIEEKLNSEVFINSNGIFDKPTIIINDKEITSEEITNVKDNTKVYVEYTWILPNGFDTNQYIEISPIPTYLEGLNKLIDKELQLFDGNEAIGTFKFQDGKIIVKFNKDFEILEEKHGNLKFEFTFSKNDFKDDNIINMDFGKDYPIKLDDGKTGGELDKKGTLSNDNKFIEWEVDINKNYLNMDTISIFDNLSDGLELFEKIELFTVNKHGVIIEQVETFDKFPIELINVNRPYKLKYKTKINKFSQSNKSFTNKVTIKSDALEKEAESTVEFNVNNLKKSGKVLTDNSGKQYIEWTIIANNKNLFYENLILEDIFGSTPKQIFLENSLKIKPNISNPILNYDEKGFILELGETDKQHIITYRTTLEDLKTKPGNSETITNKVISEDKDKNNTKLEADATTIYYRDKLVKKWGLPAGEDSDGGKLIHWTVTVNDGKEKLPIGTIIEDIALTENNEKILDLKKSTFRVTDINGNILEQNKDYNLTTDLDGLWKIELLKQFEETIRIEYDTLADPNHNIYANEVHIDLNKDGIFEDNVNSSVNPSEFKDSIYKDFTDYDFNKGEITWKVMLSSQSGNFIKLSLKDKMSSNLHYIDGTLKIELDNQKLSEITDYYFSFDKTGTLEINLTETGLSKSISNRNSILKLVYKAKFDPNIVDKDGFLKNKVGATITTVKDDEERYLEDSKIITLENWIVNNGKKQGAIDYVNRIIHWEVYLNPTEANKINEKLKDELSEGHQFVNNSFKLFIYKFDKETSTPHIDRELIQGKDYKFITNETKDSFELELLVQNQRLLIKYDTKMIGLSKDKYKNKIIIGENQDEYEAEVSFKDWNKFIDKSGDFDKDKVYPQDELKWELKINESYSQLTNVKIIDEINGGHEYLSNTLKIIDRKGNIFNDYKLIEDGNTLIIDLGNIDKSYIISYSTYVTADGDTVKSLSNKVRLESDEKSDSNLDYENVSVNAIGSGTGTGVLSGKLILKKVDTDKNPIKNNPAQFNLFRILSNGSVKKVKNQNSTNSDIYLFETDQNGVLTIEKLNLGRYLIREIQAPKGYQILKSDESFTITKETMQITLNIENDFKKPGFIKIKKVDSEDRNIKLSGAEFTVKDSSGKEFGKIITDNLGIGILEVPVGRYSIIETKAPIGYKLPVPTKTFIIDVIESNLESIDALEVDNYKEKQGLGILEIIKIDAKTKKVLKNAEFDIFTHDLKTLVDHITTDEFGLATSNLPYGKYKLKETKAPIGYELLSEFIEVEVTKKRENIVTIQNKQLTGFIKIEKIEYQNTNIKLSGAEFTVKDNSGKEFGKIITDDLGIAILEVPVGRYSITETKAPIGYKLPVPTKTFMIDVIENTIENIDVLQIDNYKNTEALGLLRVIKIDNIYNKPLEGAEFDIYSNNFKTLIGHIKTDNHGMAYANLPYGKYKLKETKAPIGYKLLPEFIEVEVTGEKISSFPTIKNEKIMGLLEILKVDAKNNSKTLEGAQFQLIKDGIIVRDIITDELGKALVYGLDFGQYTLKEIKAPTGYQKSSKTWEFKIENDLQKIFFEIGNIKTTIPPIDPEEECIINIIKIDGDTNKALDGAIFEVLDTTNNVIGKIITDKFGKGELKLKQGKYHIKEIKAPFGYTLSKDIVDIILTTENREIIKTIKNFKEPSVPQIDPEIEGLLKIEKIDSDSKIPLEGAIFEIVDENNEILGKIVTDKFGKGELKLNHGTYKIREIVSPIGYNLLKETIQFTLSNENIEITKTIENTKKPTIPTVPSKPNRPTKPSKPDKFGIIKIEKIDKNNNNTLEGAIFEILNEKGKTVGTIITDEFGQGQLKVEYGKYIIKETKAPFGYIKNSKIINVSVTQDDSSVLKTIENEKEIQPIIEIPPIPVEPIIEEIIEHENSNIEEIEKHLIEKTKTFTTDTVTSKNKLPKTGTNNSYKYYLIGLLFILLGISLDKKFRI